MTLSECKTIPDYAAYYGVSESTVKRWKARGAKLDNEQEILSLMDRKDITEHLADYRASDGVGGQAAETESENRSFTLKDSLQALIEAERIHAKAFKAADTPTARRLIQNDWLEVSKARLQLELQIHEVEKLASESLPIDEVKAMLSVRLQTYRNELDAIPSKWAVFLFEKAQWKVEEELKRLVTGLIARHLIS